MKPAWMITTPQMKHRIYVSSMKDEVLNGEVLLRREGVFKCWAQIEEFKQSYIGKEGYAVAQEAEKITHLIYIRHRSDTDYTTSAWIYEEFLKSPPRWFKILGFTDVQESARFTCFSCRLVERSEAAQVPQEPKAQYTMGLPEGIKL